MERYKLKDLYTLIQLNTFVKTNMLEKSVNGMLMGLTSQQIEEVINFIDGFIYGYFYDDFVAYEGEDINEVQASFMQRFTYDIAIKLPYWYRKYNQIKNLLTTNDLSLLQTSKMTSSSSDNTDTASGTLQKTATTPTGVSTGTASDDIDIEITRDSGTLGAEVSTEGFADKYSNAQQKFATAGKVNSQREGSILREGSIEELVNVLEKLPSSFANEINKELAHHFIFDYEMVEGEY